MRFFHNSNVNFMSTRKFSFLFSGTLILVSIISLIIHGGPRYSVDFRGGTFMEIRFEDKTDPSKILNIEIGRVRDVFRRFGLGEAEIKHYGSTQEIAARADVTENTDELMNELVQVGWRSYTGYLLGNNIYFDIYYVAI